MLIKKAYRIELNPNKKQQRVFYQHCAAVCKVWNFYLALRKEAWEMEKKSIYAMGKGESQKVTAFKAENPWLYEVASTPLIQCLRDQDQAMKHFYRRVKLVIQGKLSPNEAGYPRFKSVRRDRDRGFRFAGKEVKIDGSKIYFPRIGWVKVKEPDYFNPEAEIKNATISSSAGRWFVALGVEQEIKGKVGCEVNEQNALAVHFGIRNKMTCSNGLVVDKLLPYHRAEKRLARLQHRKDKPPPGWKDGKNKLYLGSKNKKKLAARIARLHYRIANIRKDATHKATTEIIRQNPSVLILEDWDNKGMMQDKRFAKGIADTSFYEPRRQLEYKAGWAGINVVHLPRQYKSSKTCSICGFVDDEFDVMKKVFWCSQCGHTEDRDKNAVRNVLQEGIKQLRQETAEPTGAQPGSKACGEAEVHDCALARTGAPL